MPVFGVTNKMGPPGYHVKLGDNLGMFCIFSGCRLGGVIYVKMAPPGYHVKLGDNIGMFCIFSGCRLGGNQ